MSTKRPRPPLRSGGSAWGPQRVRLGVSITDLARLTHINVGDLSKMEHGRMIPRADEYERVMAVLRDAEAVGAEGSTASS